MSTDGFPWRTTVVAPLVIVAVAGVAGWLFSGQPTPGEAWHWLESQFVDPATGTHFSVLIADLEGDADGSQTEQLAEALSDSRGLQVIQLGRVLKIGNVGDVKQNIAKAEGTGRTWLREKKADVLVWGRDTGTFLKLRFLSAGAPGRPDGLGRFGEVFELPRGFGPALGTQIVSLTLIAVAPATEAQGTYLVELLKPTALKLKKLLDDKSPGFESEQRSRLQHSFGVAATVLGEQTGDSDWLEEAVAAYRAALEERTRERVPLDWAATQNNLGTALGTLGERESGTARLEEAVAAYRAALEEWTRERVPLAWAMTQNNLGAALRTLGQRESGTARLKEAVAAYGAALEVFVAGGAGHYVGIATRNLRGVEALLAERRGRQ